MYDLLSEAMARAEQMPYSFSSLENTRNIVDYKKDSSRKCHELLVSINQIDLAGKLSEFDKDFLEKLKKDIEIVSSRLQQIIDKN